MSQFAGPSQTASQRTGSKTIGAGQGSASQGAYKASKGTQNMSQLAGPSQKTKANNHAGQGSANRESAKKGSASQESVQ